MHNLIRAKSGLSFISALSLLKWTTLRKKKSLFQLVMTLIINKSIYGLHLLIRLIEQSNFSISLSKVLLIFGQLIIN